jgi:hypothetical protein
MLHCKRALAGLVAIVIAASVALAAPASAAKGQWSIGGNFGVGMYSNTAINDTLDAAFEGSGVTPKHVKSGWEYGGSLRYGISPKASLDYEVNLMNGKGTTDANATAGTPEIEVKTTGIAGPLSLYYELGKSEKSIFNFFVGVGPMYGTKWKVTAKSNPEVVTEAKSKTGLYAHAGFEGDYMLSKSVAITARALGRYAKAKDVEWTDPADATNTQKIDVNLSGGAFSLGLRAFFGKY